MYFRVPVNNGVMDIDYRLLIQGIGISGTEAIVNLHPDAIVRESWVSITEDEFNEVKPPDPPPPIDEIAQMKSDMNTMQETINFLLGL